MPTLQPDPETFMQQARQHRLMSLQTRITADRVTPIGLFLDFDDQESAFLLESVLGGERWARYSIMGRNPLMQLEIKKNRMTFQVGDAPPRQLIDADPLQQLRQILVDYSLPANEDLPYRCALTGYFAYDFCRYLEDLPDNNPDPLDLPDCALMAPAEVMIYDHLKNELILIANILVSDQPKADYRRAKAALETLAESVSQKGTSNLSLRLDPAAPASAAVKPPQENHRDRETYMAQVHRIKQYIQRGDIFQAVLSKRFSSPCLHHPFAIYRALRTINPSPYLFFLRQAESVLVGSSPEMLVRLQNGKVETCPIAGTRRRGDDDAADRRLAEELASDEKELAEHAMLVDLARNDVGRISRIGSVKVPKYCKIERFSHVMHLVSRVEGIKHPDVSAVDVLAALLPAGTLSGAPKIRAMEIIDELEPVRRGPYGGAVGYLGFDGQADTCITIRTAVIHKDQIHIQAGAGIVADSDPASEYSEVHHKAKALYSAISRAGDYT